MTNKPFYLPATTAHPSAAKNSRRGGMSPLLTAATTAALIPFAVVFGAGVLAWGVSRDLQRTCVVRVPGVRRVLVWVGGEVERGRP